MPGIPERGAPARWVCETGPELLLAGPVQAALLDPLRARDGPPRRSITSGVRSAPGLESQARPAASAAYSPGFASARVFTNACRPPGSSTRSAWLMSPPPTAARTVAPCGTLTAGSLR